VNWRRLVQNIKVTTKMLDGAMGGNNWWNKSNDRIISIIGGPPKSNAYEYV